MKRTTLSVLSLSAVLLAAGFAVGQTTPKIGVGAAAPAQQKFALVATIKGAQAVREFQNNVQVLQNQRQALVDLEAAMNKEKDAKKKAKMKSDFDAQLAKLNENNALMAKTYGFSLTRNYTMEIETANIYIQVSDEEAAKIEQAVKAEQAKAKK
ncbi:hypothetical protein [Opitutus sp. ER46]|uniref:hypothetical protein n=1 Tax=Opitutus sp. ER46 TaxID=2161864 RepID=UPI000D305C9A|nr:hypothetical protein [Opitutus sp. ER46]PTX94273.1 hypothetical protein DB354_10945 [Opitutus sp. ER46]